MSWVEQTESGYCIDDGVIQIIASSIVRHTGMNPIECIKKHESFKGKRMKRGLFKSEKGLLINADLNGALNILRKVIGNFNYDPIKVCSAPSVLTVK